VQAEPVAALLHACRRRDPGLLRVLSSQRLRDGMAAAEWPVRLDVYATMVGRLLGERYDDRALDFRYEGGETAGYVTVTCHERGLPALPVVYEDQRWRLDG